MVEANVVKVVCKFGADLLSAVESSDLCVVYESGIRSIPSLSGSKLFAFSSIEYAMEWVGEPQPAQFEIWRAYGEDVTEQNRRILNVFVHRDAVTDFWNGTADEHIVVPTPVGSVSCSAITLLEKIA